MVVVVATLLCVVVNHCSLGACNMHHVGFESPSLALLGEAPLLPSCLKPLASLAAAVYLRLLSSHHQCSERHQATQTSQCLQLQAIRICLRRCHVFPPFFTCRRQPVDAPCERSAGAGDGHQPSVSG